MEEQVSGDPLRAGPDRNRAEFTRENSGDKGAVAEAVDRFGPGHAMMPFLQPVHDGQVGTGKVEGGQQGIHVSAADTESEADPGA